MKHCKGKFHGDVSKTIRDDEDFCLICSKRRNAEKKQKRDNIKKIITNIAEKAVVVGAPIVINKLLEKKNDKS